MLSARSARGRATQAHRLVNCDDRALRGSALKLGWRALRAASSATTRAKMEAHLPHPLPGWAARGFPGFLHYNSLWVGQQPIQLHPLLQVPEHLDAWAHRRIVCGHVSTGKWSVCNKSTK
jgi:hypothetical protein